ncbi:hypothetical protein SAMN05444339_106181 [Loktanella atrilutea]|uniref:DUF1178 family protein n=1 Tax=Loktanella atrilutea TaxID=366533 RepID=A0A1M5BUR8_LOKAT|nr:DUF1178 family protein [Loktanella atrilutea]SHF46160.1 hypothetical protein SAMN05444339_106181 [Loktanella atrilutea]
MIRYTLTCENSHRFDSWFRSAAAFEALADQGHLSCATCGSPQVTKSVMTPSVATDRAEPSALERLRAHVEATSEDVGDRFAAEARAIHDGDAPDRPIIGQANGAQVRALIADDIPVLPLPFMPRRRTN